MRKIDRPGSICIEGNPLLDEKVKNRIDRPLNPPIADGAAILLEPPVIPRIIRLDG